MQAFVEFLKSIPDVIWSALLASLLTLSGVLISNASNTRRLERQLAHDASEQAKERTAVLRREVYLRAVEEMVRANAYLAGLPQLDLAKVNAGEGLQNFFAAAARLQLVAESDTALLLNRLTADYGELVMQLMVQLQPASQAKIDVAVADELYTKANAEVTRVLAAMAQLNESGKQDSRAVQALSSSFDFQQRQTRRYADERDRAWNSYNRHSAVFHRLVLTQLKDIGKQHVTLQVALRKDLGLTSDLAQIEAQMNEQWERMSALFDVAIAAIVEPTATSQS